MRIRLCLFLLLFPTIGLAAPRLIRHDGGIPNQYIVVLRDETPSAAVQRIVDSLRASYGVRSAAVWEYSLKGFLAIGTEQQANAMLNDARVDYIEQNILGAGIPSGVETTWIGQEYLWHLDRLDDKDYGPPWPGNPDGRDSTYNKCPVGTSVYAYVIDTGVWSGHTELDNRLVLKLDFSADQPNQSLDDPPDVTNACATLNPNGGWHGTAVASLVAGHTVGAAETKVVSLKIAQCNTAPHSPGFSAASVISALNWINSPRNDFRYYPGVINFSGFFFQFDAGVPSLRTTLRNTIAATQFPFFTSADNFSGDACAFFPNDEAYTNVAKSGRTVFVVGATSTGVTFEDNNDYRFQYWDNCPSCIYKIGQDSGSNGGACVSAYAPGVSIYAARSGAYNAYDRASGSSFSSPLAAGLAARYIEKQITQTGIRPTHTAVYDFLLNQGQVYPQWLLTAPTHSLCVFPDPQTLNPTVWAYRSIQYSCPYNGYLVQMNQVNNASNAKMLYWSSTCP